MTTQADAAAIYTELQEAQANAEQARFARLSDEDEEQAQYLRQWQPGLLDLWLDRVWRGRWLGWLCLLGIGAGTLVVAGLVRSLPLAVAGLALMLLLVGWARKAGR